MTPNMTSKPSANNMYLCKDVVITQLFLPTRLVVS